MNGTKLGRVWSPGRVLVVLVMLVGLAFTLGGPTSASSHKPTLSVDPAAKKAYLGETFTVSVNIADAHDVVGYQFMLDFDPAVIALSNPMDGGFIAEPDLFDCSIAGGTATCTVLETPPYDGGADGSGMLVSFDAEIVGTGTSPLALHNAQVSNSDGETVEDPYLEQGMVTSVVALEVIPSPRSVNLGTFTEQVMIHNASDLTAFEFKMAFDPDVVQVDDVALGPFLESEGRTVDPGLIQEDIDNVYGDLFFAAASLPTGDAPDGDGVLVEITFNAVMKGDTELDLFDSKIYDDSQPPVEMMPVNLDGMIYVVDEGIHVKPMHQEVFEGETFTVDIEVGDAQDLTGFEFTLGFDETLVNVTDIEVGPFLTDVTSHTKDIDNVNGTAFFGAFSLPPGDTGETGTLATVHLEALEVDADMTSPLDIMDPAFFDSTGSETVPEDTDGDVLVKNCVPVTINSLVADSSADNPTPLGDPVQFTADVSGSAPITYDWDFGGAGTATGEDTATPTFTYDAPGTYVVTLTADNCGDPAVETVTVVVCDPVDIFDVDTNSPVELGETMHFTATVSGTPPFGYRWDFGDGTAPVDLTVNVASHTYADVGMYTVTLTAGNCSITNPFTDVYTTTVEVLEPTFQLFIPLIAEDFITP
jgi:hypothetical protein